MKEQELKKTIKNIYTQLDYLKDYISNYVVNTYGDFQKIMDMATSREIKEDDEQKRKFLAEIADAIAEQSHDNINSAIKEFNLIGRVNKVCEETKKLKEELEATESNDK